MMLNFQVPDIGCGHCANAITEAVKAVDGNAAVAVDIDRKTVAISTTADAAAITVALTEAGYPPAQ